jgi:hypothetical protein
MKSIFADPTFTKLNFEAKKACKKQGIEPNELKEKTFEEFKYNAGPNDTEEILQMRTVHYENRRRKKLRIINDFIKRNRYNLMSPKVSATNVFNSS